jgi:hypothetical protein
MMFSKFWVFIIPMLLFNLCIRSIQTNYFHNLMSLDRFLDYIDWYKNVIFKLDFNTSIILY